MPLVRIDIRKGRPPGFGKRAGEAVYAAMRETINVPENDNFQIINEHDADGLIYDAGYLGIARTDGFLVVQITLNHGRTVEMKKALYHAIAERLAAIGVRREDVFIGLVEVPKENWSFGNGAAQYAT